MSRDLKSGSVEGRTEKHVAKRAAYGEIKNIILASAYIATLAGAAIVIPNAVQLLKHLQPGGATPRLKQRIRETYSRLIKAGLLERIPTEHGSKVVLTDQGKQLGEELAIVEQLKHKKPKKWDQKWRVIMFDVWERRRGVRDQLRDRLVNVGFIKIQHSVWVYPYPCEELLVFLRTEFKLGKGILYMVVDEIEGDEPLRKHFSLPLR